MSGSPYYESLTRVVTPSVTAEIITHHKPEAMAAITMIVEEPLHVIAMQEKRTPGDSQGRYLADERDGQFRDIGRLLVLPAQLPLEVQATVPSNQAIRCMFSPATLRAHGGEFDSFDRQMLASFLNLRLHGAPQLLGMLAYELKSPGMASAALIESLGTSLVIKFARYLNNLPLPEEVYRGGLSRQHLRMVIDYIEAHDSCPSLSELSEMTDLSLRHMTRAFKQSTGTTVYSYIEEVRFKKAQAMLISSDRLIKDIAFRLGFSCASSFSVAFRKVAGESPAQYRKRLRATGHSITKH